MKFFVRSPLKHNGEFYPVESLISFKSADDVPSNLVPLLEAACPPKGVAPEDKKAACPPKGAAPKKVK